MDYLVVPLHLGHQPMQRAIMRRRGNKTVSSKAKVQTWLRDSQLWHMAWQTAYRNAEGQVLPVMKGQRMSVAAHVKPRSKESGQKWNPYGEL